MEYERFIKGQKLSRKQAMLAQCYQCNGFEESNEDCQGKDCPMYPYMYYKGKKKGEEGGNASLGHVGQDCSFKMLKVAVFSFKKAKKS